MSAIANSNQPEDKPKTSRVKAYWRNIPWQKLSSLVMAIALCFYLTACGGGSKPTTQAPVKTVATSNIIEVSPPTEIQHLSRLLDQYEPKVSIISPKPDEVLNDDQVAIKFDVKNLPIFKNAEFGLGPHIHVTLDNQEYKALYDLNQTATFTNLSAGTHTIRAFASRPWHESFKNQGAYAQTTFNVLTKTGENTPEVKTPLLTYSRPVGTYGAEPVLLDFYLQNVPLPSLGKDEQTVEDWQVRATVNGQSFTFDRWEPIYLKGLNQGKNWVKLELLEDDGDAIANVFNSTAHVINYQPNGTDTLARLVRGEKIANIEAIVNPNYVPPTPTPETPVDIVTPEPVITPTVKVEETPKPISPKVPVAPVKQEEVKVAPTSSVVPVKTTPEAIAPTKAPVKSEPVKIAPVKNSPVTVPTKAVPTNKPITTAAPEVIKKDAIPEKASKNSGDYFKNYDFKSHTSTTRSEVVKPAIAKPEVKTSVPIANPKLTLDAKLQSKSTDNTPVLTDLSATTSSPVKLLTK